MASRFARQREEKRAQLVGDLVVKMIPGVEEGEENFHRAVQFVQDSLDLHKFGSTDANKVRRTYAGLVEKFVIHTQKEKATTLDFLLRKFLNTDLPSDVTEQHEGLLSLLFHLSDAPVVAPYEPQLGFLVQRQEEEARERGTVWGKDEASEGSGAEESDDGKRRDDGDDELSVWSDVTDEEPAPAVASPGPMPEPPAPRADIEAMKRALTRRDTVILVPDSVSTLPLDTSLPALPHEAPDVAVGPRAERYWRAEGSGGNTSALNLSLSITTGEFERTNPSSLRGALSTHVRRAVPGLRHDPVGAGMVITMHAVLREVVGVLRGEAGVIFTRHEGAFTVDPSVQVEHLSPEALQTTLRRYASVGDVVVRVREFVRRTQAPHGRTAQAFAAWIGERLDEYGAMVSAIEDRIVGLTGLPAIGLTQLDQQWQPARRLLELLDVMVTECAVPEIEPLAEATETNTAIVTTELTAAQRAASVLTGLHIILEQESMCDTAAFPRALSAFCHALCPYLDMLGAWVAGGVLEDPHNEFMIAKALHGEATSDFWSHAYTLRGAAGGHAGVPRWLRSIADKVLVAGKSIIALRQMYEDAGPVPRLDDLRHGFFLVILDLFPECARLEPPPPPEIEAERKADADTDAPVFTSVASNLRWVPTTDGSVISLPGTSRQLPAWRADAASWGAQNEFLAGTGAIMLVDGRQQFSMMMTQQDRLDVRPTLQYPDAAPRALHARDLDFTRLTRTVSAATIIETGVLARVRAVHGLVAPRLVAAVLPPPCALLSHLAWARDVFFLTAGDAMHEYSVAIFEKIDTGEEWHDDFTLSSTLTDALAVARHPAYSLFSVAAVEPNANGILFGMAAELDGVNISFNVTWPVNVVFSGAIVDDYRLIHSLLMQVRRAKWALGALRPELSKEHPSPMIHKQQLLRQRLLHFVTTLEHYFLSRVVAEAWEDFAVKVNDPAHASDLDALCRLHGQYVARIKDRCLLGPKVVRIMEKIITTLNVCVEFRLRYLELISDERRRGPELAPVFARLEREFDTQHQFLLTLLTHIVARGSLVHLEDLLTRLNYNRFYAQSSRVTGGAPFQAPTAPRGRF